MWGGDGVGEGAFLRGRWHRSNPVFRCLIGSLFSYLCGLQRPSHPLTERGEQGKAVGSAAGQLLVPCSLQGSPSCEYTQPTPRPALSGLSQQGHLNSSSPSQAKP